MKENIKKSNSAEDSLLEVQPILSSIKEETKGTLKTLLSEAVKNYMKESIISEAEEDKDEDSYEVEDVDDNITDDSKDDAATDAADSESEIDIESSVDDADVADAESSEENSEDGDEWTEFDQYKTDDGSYDFTGVEDDTIIKVYKLLNDDDQVVVKRDDNMVNIKDNETGAEYVIELDPDAVSEDNVDNSDSLENESVTESYDWLGYTDDYQDVDPMTNDGVVEPAKSSQTTTWDKVPTGTKKPWAGNGKKAAPFDEQITEEEDSLNPDEIGDEEIVDEITTVTSNNARKMSKTHTSEPRRNNLPHGSKHISANGKYDESVTEAILKKAKAMQEENKQYKAIVSQIKDKLQEAAVVNVSLGQIVKLFTENTTSTQEKKSIIERFSSVTSVKESKTLYESIKKELNKGQKSNVVLEKQMTTSSAKINETPVYQSDDMLKALDLMKRVENC